MLNTLYSVQGRFVTFIRKAYNNIVSVGFPNFNGIVCGVLGSETAHVCLGLWLEIIEQIQRSFSSSKIMEDIEIMIYIIRHDKGRIYRPLHLHIRKDEKCFILASNVVNSGNKAGGTRPPKNSNQYNHGVIRIF